MSNKSVRVRGTAVAGTARTARITWWDRGTNDNGTVHQIGTGHQIIGRPRAVLDGSVLRLLRPALPWPRRGCGRYTLTARVSRRGRWRITWRYTYPMIGKVPFCWLPRAWIGKRVTLTISNVVHARTPS